jgi:hypothetical protein
MAKASSGEVASGGEPAPVLTNADRLRAHLKPEGLAVALLDAWTGGDAADAQSRMMKALEAFHR